jgi:hypothetical protein
MSLRNLLNRMKGEIDELYAIAKRAGQSNAAFGGSRVYATGAAPPTAPTAGGANIIVAAMTQIAKQSGVFLVSISMPFTGATAADTIDFRVTTQTKATPIAFTNDQLVGQGLSASANAFVSTAAGGILVTGGPFSSVTQYDSGAQVQPTGATTGILQFNGIINAVATSIPFAGFPIGNSVAVLFDVSFGAHTLALAADGVTMWMVELPQGVGR